MPRGEDTNTVSIRFPLPMYDRIKDLAESSFRSFNKQVLMMLASSIKNIEPVIDFSDLDDDDFDDFPED